MADADILRLLHRDGKLSKEEMWMRLPYSFFQIDQALQSLLKRNLIVWESYTPVINTSDDGSIDSYYLPSFSKQSTTNTN